MQTKTKIFSGMFLNFLVWHLMDLCMHITLFFREKSVTFMFPIFPDMGEVEFVLLISLDEFNWVMASSAWFIGSPWKQFVVAVITLPIASICQEPSLRLRDELTTYLFLPMFLFLFINVFSLTNLAQQWFEWELELNFGYNYKIAFPQYLHSICVTFITIVYHVVER